MVKKFKYCLLNIKEYQKEQTFTNKCICRKSGSWFSLTEFEHLSAFNALCNWLLLCKMATPTCKRLLKCTIESVLFSLCESACVFPELGRFHPVKAFLFGINCNDFLVQEAKGIHTEDITGISTEEAL